MLARRQSLPIWVRVIGATVVVVALCIVGAFGTSDGVESVAVLRAGSVVRQHGQKKGAPAIPDQVEGKVLGGGGAHSGVETYGDRPGYRAVLPLLAGTVAGGQERTPATRATGAPCSGP